MRLGGSCCSLQPVCSAKYVQLQQNRQPVCASVFGIVGERGRHEVFPSGATFDEITAAFGRSHGAVKAISTTGLEDTGQRR